MTQAPLTKEAVEREIRLLENNASDCHVRTETVALLRALSARVEELAAKAKKDALDCLSDVVQLMEEVEEAHGNGRLQGLNEAVQYHRESERRLNDKIEDDDTPISQALFSARLAGHNFDAEAIEALKGETTND